MPQGQRYKGGIDRSRHNFFRQMRRVSMRWPYMAYGHDLFVQIAEGSKQPRINQRSASESNGTNFTTLNRNQCVDDLIPRLQQQLCQCYEGKAGFRWPNSPALHLAKETNRSVLLELSGLNAEIGLRGTQLLRSSSESLSLQDR